MKKIIAIILMIVMVFSTNSVYADEPEETSYADAVEIVKALGFMSGYSDGTFRPAELVTRAEYACIISNVLNFFPDVSKGETTPFYDVTASHWASPYVNIVNSNALMCGDGNGKFSPEQNITVAETIKVIINMTGYGALAEVNGGWPQGYLLQANSLHLLDDIKTSQDGFVTRGEMAQILCSSFEVDIYTSYSYSSEVSIRKENGVTLLSKYHNIYDAEGVVTANNLTAVNSASEIRDNEVEIDGERFFTDFDMTPYLGYNVKIYYHQDKENEDNRTIIYVKQKNNNVIEIEPDSIDNIRDNKITYLKDNGKDYSITFNNNANIIYNNEFISRAINFDFNKLLTVNGTITLIDNNADKKYDVIFVKDYTIGVVDGVNVNSKRINFKWGVAGLNLENSKYVIYSDDKKIALSQLSVSDVICIAASDSFKKGVSDSVVEIFVCNENVSGKVVNLDQNEVVIETKDGRKKYEVSSKYISKKGAKISVSDEGVFYIDMSGRIVSCIHNDGHDMRFGYLINARLEEKLSTEVFLKILTSVGNVEIFKARDKVYMDGTSVAKEKMYKELEKLSVGNQISMIIRYSVNEDGLVNAIDTELPNSDNDVDELTISTINVSGGMRYQVQSTMLVSGRTSQRYIMDSSVIIFSIPDAGSQDDEYKVYDNTYFIGEKYYGDTTKGQNMSMCNVKDGVPAAVIMKAGEAATNLGSISLSDCPSAVIKKKLLALNEDGEECTKLILDSKGTEVELIITDKTALLFTNGTTGANNVSNKLPGSEKELTIDDFNFGDIVMYDKGVKNRANIVLRINDSNVYNLKQGEYQVTGMSGYTEFVMGSVRKKIGTILELDVSTDPNLLLNAKITPYVALVENRGNKVTTVTFDEIWASESDLDADKIFARVRFGHVGEIYIYR